VNTRLNPSRSGVWLVLIAAFLWGTIGIATQAIYQLETTTSLFINLARTLIAAPVILALCWRIIGGRMFVVRPRDLLIMLVSGALLALSHAAYFAAIRAAGVTIPTLLTICIAPLMVAALSALLRLEKLTRRTAAALCCALLGAVLLVGLQGDTQSQADLLVGALYSLAAAASYGSAIVCGRFLAADYHPLQVTAFGFCAGAAVLIALNLASGIAAFQTPQGWLLAIYLGLVPTALAYALFQMGLRSVPATTASIISMLDPLVAAALAWLLFGEMLTLAGIVGALLLLGSILFLTAGRRE
jgi:DME family drug/metabolite transporter